MQIMTKGIITKIRDFSENDLLIDVFTVKKGKVTMIVKNGKRSKSKLSSASNLFIYGEFDIFMGKKWNRLNDIEIIESFYWIREDLYKLSYGSYLLELTNASIVRNKSDEAIFILLLQGIHGLKSKKYLQLKVIYEFKLLCALGYQPEVYQCSQCGLELNEHIAFSVEAGGILCHRCNHEKALNISPKMKKIFQYFLQNDFSALLEVDIHSVFLNKIEIILYKYMAYYLERSDFKSLDFIKLLKDD